MSRPKYRDYPDTPNIRSGAKVGWRYYDRLIDAKACAAAAKFNAAIKLGEGFDFGYRCPGSIVQIKDGEYAGKFEVTIP